MSDRHPHPRSVQALTAAARILQPVNQDTPKALEWHDEAWGYRDTVGELRFAELWLGNAFSRSRLIAARRPSPGEEPQPVDSGPAYDLVSRLAGGVGGQSALLRNFAPFLLIPGCGYLVGEPKGSAEKFIVVDQADIKLGTDKEGNPGFELREDDGSRAWRSLEPGTVVTKVYRPHPRRRWESDSPTRAALTILKELVLLTMHVEATANSRLAGAGVQAWPAEIDFPPGMVNGQQVSGWDKFLDEYYSAITKPAKDRSLVSALAPFAVKMPADLIPKWKDGYISYATPFDDKAKELRDEAITRLGNAMDLPRQVLTGEQSNHWGNWQIEESSLKMHIEPGLETICDGLTVGFLDPGLSAAEEGDRGARLDLERQQSKEPEGEWLIWYDTSDLRVRPDRSTAAEGAYDRWELGGEDYRQEQGLSDAEAIDVKTPEVQQRIWLSLLHDSNMAPLALKKLGLATDEELDAVKPQAPPPGGPPGMEPGEPGDNRGPRGLPEREPPKERPAAPVPPSARQRPRAAQPPVAATVHAAPEPDLPPTAEQKLGLIAAAEVMQTDIPDHPPTMTPGVAIVAALDGIVYRALERAGRRALNKLPRTSGKAPRQIAGADCPAVKLHTCVQIDRLLPMETLLEEAWERVPEVAERLGEDAPALVATCDAYARTLIREQVEHDWDGLARALGVCPCEEEEHV